MARAVVLLWAVLHHSAAFSLLAQQRTNAATAMRASDDDAIDASSPDAFLAGLMNRVDELKARQLELPIVVLDATLPNQRLAISTSDQAFREMVEYCGVKAVEEAGDEQAPASCGLFDEREHPLGVASGASVAAAGSDGRPYSELSGAKTTMQATPLDTSFETVHSWLSSILQSLSLEHECLVIALVLLYAPLYPPFYILGALAMSASLAANKFALSYWWGRPPTVGEEMMERLRNGC